VTLLFPVFLAIAIAISLTPMGQFSMRRNASGKGPVFSCFKFRTMVRDAGERQAELMHIE